MLHGRLQPVQNLRDVRALREGERLSIDRNDGQGKRERVARDYADDRESKRMMRDKRFSFIRVMRGRSFLDERDRDRIEEEVDD